MIVTRPDIGFLRTDDDFILRFLRARKFDQVETFRLLAQYFQFRQQNLDMFQSFKVCSCSRLLHFEHKKMQIFRRLMKPGPEIQSTVNLCQLVKINL